MSHFLSLCVSVHLLVYSSQVACPLEFAFNLFFLKFIILFVLSPFMLPYHLLPPPIPHTSPQSAHCCLWSWGLSLYLCLPRPLSVSYLLRYSLINWWVCLCLANGVLNFSHVLSKVVMSLLLHFNFLLREAWVCPHVDPQCRPGPASVGTPLPIDSVLSPCRHPRPNW